jgi:hypothetical protein
MAECSAGGTEMDLLSFSSRLLSVKVSNPQQCLRLLPKLPTRNQCETNLSVVVLSSVKIGGISVGHPHFAVEYPSKIVGSAHPGVVLNEVV